MSSKEVIKQITDLTAKLIGSGLSIEQSYPAEKDGVLYIAGCHDMSVALKNIDYSEIYMCLEEDKNYNIKMIDGALIQLMYTFDVRDGILIKHRLAFFPSPILEKYANESEVYDKDELYGSIINQKNIVPTPLRFDYDPANFCAVEHPKVHLTIGQYEDCRIPVVSPITPYVFIDFILRNFYKKAFTRHSASLSFNLSHLFSNTIDAQERNILHMSIAI